MKKHSRKKISGHKTLPYVPKQPITPMLIANWKMNLTLRESLKAAHGLVRDLGDLGMQVSLVVCPSHIAVAQVGRALEGTDIALGAQDVYWEDKGSYTGEVSAPDLRELGVRYIIIGHSERRTNLGETDDMVNRKVLAAVRHGLTPIVCVGEHADERRLGHQELVVTRQVQAAFRNVRPPFRGKEFVIAYEPLWAISGSGGEACDPKEAGRMAEVIQYALLELYDERIVRDTIRILYGGSATALNVRSYLSHPPISGSLIGGASLAPASFLAMAAASAPRDTSHGLLQHKKHPSRSRRHHPPHRR